MLRINHSLGSMKQIIAKYILKYEVVKDAWGYLKQIFEQSNIANICFDRTRSCDPSVQHLFYVACGQHEHTRIMGRITLFWIVQLDAPNHTSVLTTTLWILVTNMDLGLDLKTKKCLKFE